jgi:hypothetical protein
VATIGVGIKKQIEREYWREDDMFENKARCLRMYVSCFWLTALLTTTSLVTSARQQEATNPQTVSNIDIQTLIRESDRNGRKEFSRYRDHTYKVRQIRRVRGGDGKVKEESWVYEMIFPDSKHLIKKHVRVHQILIEENSKAIPSERLAKEREKFGKQLEKVESVSLRDASLTHLESSRLASGRDTEMTRVSRKPQTYR